MFHSTPASHEDIDHRFDYHRPDAERVISHESVRGKCRDLAHDLDTILPPGREKSLALTKLEEVLMWSNAAIARTAPQPVGTVRSGVIGFIPVNEAELIDDSGSINTAAGPSA